VIENHGLLALSRPGLEIGANRAKSTEGTQIQSESSFQSVSTDFARLDRDFQSRAGSQRNHETVIFNYGRGRSGTKKLAVLFKHPLMVLLLVPIEFLNDRLDSIRVD
jgi:hypothetical protein